VLDHEHDGLAADIEPTGDRRGLVLVAQVSTRTCSSLSSAASTDFWCVSGTLNLRGQLLPGFAKGVLQRVDDE